MLDSVGAAVADVGVYHCRLEIAVTQQLLNAADFRSGFQQMGRRAQLFGRFALNTPRSHSNPARGRTARAGRSSAGAAPERRHSDHEERPQHSELSLLPRVGVLVVGLLMLGTVWLWVRMF
jgi:hypothetical protein